MGFHSFLQILTLIDKSKLKIVVHLNKSQNWEMKKCQKQLQVENLSKNFQRSNEGGNVEFFKSHLPDSISFVT